MNAKTATQKTSFVVAAAESCGNSHPTKPDHNAPPTIEHFESERMGIVAKE